MDLDPVFEKVVGSTFWPAVHLGVTGWKLETFPRPGSPVTY